MAEFLEREELARFLATTDLPIRADAIVPARWRVVRARELLLREGDRSDVAYLVHSGLLEACTERPAQRLAWLGAGAWIGEVGALTGEPRTASVRAWRDSVVLEWDADATRAMLTEHREGLAALTLHLLSRGRRSRRPRPAPFVLGVVLDGVAPAVVDALRVAASDFKDMSLVTGEMWCDGDPALVAAVERRGRVAPLLALVADPEDTPWTRMVIRSADRVALLADANHPTELTPLERRLGLPDAARSLDVLLVGDAPRGVEERWKVGELRRAREGIWAVRADAAEDLGDYLGLVAEEHARPERLARYSLFQGLDQGALAEVLECVEWRSVRGGARLIAAGDSPDGLYLLRLGRLEASARAADGRRISLSQHVEGGLVGEVSLLMSSERTADVHASRDSRVGFISAAAFRRLQEVVPEIGKNAAEIVSRRAFVPAHARPQPAPRNLTVLCLDDSARARGFLDALSRALADVCGRPVASVTAEFVERHLGAGAAALHPGQPGYMRRIALLRAVEADHAVTIYACSSEQVDWARFCMRQGDRLVVVAEASGDPRPRSIERAAEDEHARDDPRPIDLVLLQRAGVAAASGTAAWLEARPEAFVHHVRDESRADVASAARRILGCAFGVSFSGGAARAAAHVGVVRAMRDLGLPIDFVSGTSSGAGVAASISAGMSPEEALDIAVHMVTRLSIKPWDFQPPMTALTSGRRINRLLQDVVGERRVEDQLLPLRIAAVDLVKHRVVYLDRGLMWLLIRASGSLPIVFPPVFVDGQILVDGGIISNNPVAPLLPACQRGLVVMSDLADLSAWEDLEQAAGYGAAISGWRQLIDHVLPWRAPQLTPKLDEILFRAMIVANYTGDERRQILEHPAVCRIWSPTKTSGVLDMTAALARRMERETYERAMEALPAWLERAEHLRRDDA
ncbi:MAG: cyclic nucleotide-binding domain-containing protein [Myxococcales bacterium]|nr:cyclic nucleotide-binding domain-containing protein [Myxococcales bacterium]